MTKIPDQISRTVEAVYREYESGRENKTRPHLGASLIGRECERELWYSFRWCSSPGFDGRMLRLFETGHLEEARFVNNLRSIGVEVYDVDELTGQQYGFSDFGGHFGGSVDGVGLGIHEAPKTWHLLEFKTYNDRRFASLKKHGVEQTSPEHYTQMVIYMDYLGLKRAFYFAVNKNTDELYGERIKADPTYAKLLKLKAKRIVFEDRPLTRLSDDPEYWKCRFCDHRSICHENRLPEVNCRTCLHSTPIDGGWQCSRDDQLINLKAQHAGCSNHLYIPDLLSGEVIDAGNDWVNYVLKDGSTMRNGHGGLSSKRLWDMHGTT